MRKIKYERIEDKRMYILMIYDISSNKKRVKLSHLLEGYGSRVQLSAFEFLITKQDYEELLKKINLLISSDDSFRIYVLDKQSKGFTNMQESIGADIYIA